MPQISAYPDLTNHTAVVTTFRQSLTQNQR
jgi:hypothetical protein